MLEQNSKSVHSDLLSTPKDPLAGNKPVLMVTWAVSETFGGMTSMCLRRSGLFHDRGVPSAVVTFDANPDLETISASLRTRGKLHAQVPLINLHDYYASNLTPSNDSSSLAPLSDEISWDEFSRTFRSIDGTLLKISYTSHLNPKFSRREYFRRDGSIYLIDLTLPTTKHAEQLHRSLQLISTQGTVDFTFTSAANLYRHWLTEIVDRTNADVIIDSKYSASFLYAWMHPRALKFVNFHSTHVAAGQDLLTGALSSAHTKIIENRESWDGITFLTNSQRNAFTQRFQKASNTVVIGNPVDGPAELPRFEDRVPDRVVCIGRLTKGKNITSVIDIIRLVAESGTPVHLDLLGDGDQRESLERYADVSGVRELVTFHGHVGDVAQYLSTSKALLLCSKYEGQPLAILEAQAHGCVPVAFDINFGPRDVISNQESGVVVKNGDISAAAHAISSLLKGPPLCKALSTNSFEAARAYGSDHIFAQWQEELILARSRKSERMALSNTAVRLVGLRFHTDGDLEIDVAVANLTAELTGLALVASESGSVHLRQETFLPFREDHGIFSIRVSSKLLSKFSSDSILDLKVELEIGRSIRAFRLGTSPRLRSIPFLSDEGYLRIK